VLTSNFNTQSQIFASLPEQVQEAIAAYADAADLSPDAVIQFAIAHFLELEYISPDTKQNLPKTGNVLDDLPGSLRHEVRNYAVEQEMPPEFVVELAIAHFLDPDCVTFDDCQVGLQRDRIELLRHQKQVQQQAAA
jgi:hypothetical protein